MASRPRGAGREAKLRQRAAIGTGPPGGAPWSGWRGSRLVAELAQRLLVATPVAADDDLELEEDALVQEHLELLAGAPADLLDHRAARADDHAPVTGLLHPDLGGDDDGAALLDGVLPLDDLHGHRVGELLAEVDH